VTFLFISVDLWTTLKKTIYGGVKYNFRQFLH